MKKGDINLIAQLLTGMKDAVARLEMAHRNKDVNKLAAIKREILDFQEQIKNLL